MTFKEAVAALAQKLGVEIAVDGDACALRAGAKDGTSVIQRRRRNRQSRRKQQLEEFVVMFCQTGDASGIKDVVDSTIELDAEKGKNSGKQGHKKVAA